MRVTDESLDDASTATARVRRPDGTVETVQLDRVAGTVFEGEMPGSGPGAYWVAVTVDDGAGGRRTTSSGAVSSYQPEFAFGDPDPTLAADLAAPGEGRVVPTSTEVWDRAPVAGRSSRSVWPLLVAVALAGFAADVLLRRWSRAPGWLAGATPAQPASELGADPAPAGPPQPGSPRPGPPPPLTASDSETLERLMRRKRR